jgi:hypothetical protein
MDSVFIEVSLVVIFVSRQGGAGREGSAPHDRVFGQTFLNGDFSVAIGEQGSDKKAKAGAHRFES